MAKTIFTMKISSIKFILILCFSFVFQFAFSQCDETTVCTPNNCPANEADLADGGEFCGTCTINVGGSITITDDVCWVSGTLQIDGNGGETEFTLNAGATLNIVSGVVHVDDGGADILGDIVIMNGAEFRQTAANNIRVNGGTITVESGGLLDVQDDFLVYNGAVFTIDAGGVANIGDDLRNSANGNGGPGSYGTIVVNGTLNVPDSDADIVIYDTNPDDSSLSGTGIINYGGSLTDGEGGIFSDCISPCDGSVLPVDLISFVGQLYEGNQIAKLEWITGSEENNLGFYIERSIDGIEFEEIGFVEGNGSTSDINTYSFLDQSMFISSYYRLRQVDYDGGYEYSHWVFVSMIDSSVKNAIRLYPNPTQGAISFGGLVNEIYDIKVMDMTGRVILTIEKQSLIDSEYAINKAIEQHTKGLFLFQFVNPGLTQSIRLIKN